MGWNVGQNLNVATYQYADGSNFTLAGYDLKFKGGLGTFVGMGTDFASEPVGIIDLKESNTYRKGGLLGQNVRLRTKTNQDGLESTQVRVSPCTVNVPLKDGKTSLYVNPHYVGTYNYETKKWKNGAGIFFGGTYKINNDVSVSAEVQRYNLHEISDNSAANWSGNVIFSVRLP